MIIVLDDLKNNLNGFLKNNALWIALVIVGIILITISLILIFGRKKKETKPKIAEQSLWMEALGGKDNIVKTEAYGSRLVINLVDKTKMNKDGLKSLGVSNIIEMSDKVTLVLEDQAEQVKKELDK